MIQLLVVFVIATSVNAFAGTEVGNGGNGLVCKNPDGGVSVELLDYFEARTLREISIDLGEKTLSVQEKVAIALNRLKALSPSLFQVYSTYASQFMENVRFLKNDELVTIPDSFYVAIPKGCEVKQLAIQKEPEFQEDKRYVVNEDLWNSMDGDSKAGLILHEVIYRNAIEEQGAANSVGARYINSKISSKSFESFHAEDFVDMVRRSSFKWVDLDQFRIDLTHEQPLRFDESKDRLLEAPLVPTKSVHFGNNDISASYIWMPNSSSQRYTLVLARPQDLQVGEKTLRFIGEDSKLEIYSNGAIRGGSVAVGENFSLNGPVSGTKNVDDWVFMTADSSNSVDLGFSENGKFDYAGNAKGSIILNGHEFKFHNATSKLYGDRSFWIENGSLGMFTVDPFKLQSRPVNYDPQSSVLVDIGDASLVRIFLLGSQILKVGDASLLLKCEIYSDHDVIQSATLDQDAVLTDVDGSSKKYLTGTLLRFDSFGKVKSSDPDGCEDRGN